MSEPTHRPWAVDIQGRVHSEDGLLPDTRENRRHYVKCVNLVEKLGGLEQARTAKVPPGYHDVSDLYEDQEPTEEEIFAKRLAALSGDAFSDLLHEVAKLKTNQEPPR